MREICGCSLYTSELLTFPSLVYKMALIGKTDSTNGSMALVFYIQGKRFVKIKQSTIFKEFDGKSTENQHLEEKKIQSFLEDRQERVSRDCVNLFVYRCWLACAIDIPDLEWPQPYPGRRRNFWALYSYPHSLGRDALTR